MPRSSTGDGQDFVKALITFLPLPPLIMLYLIGLGLGDERDITVKGLEAIKSCSRIFLDAYTSILGVDKNKLVS